MSGHEVVSASSSAEMVQSKTQAFRCSWCRISFDSAVLLNAHMESKHKKNRDCYKPFICKVCDKQFYLKDNLVNHLRRKPTCLRIYRKNYSEALEERRNPAQVETLTLVKEIIQNQQEVNAPIVSTLQHSTSNDERHGSVDRISSASNAVPERNRDSSMSSDCVVTNPQSVDRPLNEEGLNMEQAPKGKIYSCADCEKVFNNRFTLWRHKKLRRDCEKSSLPIFDPNKHIVTSTTSDGKIVRIYKCPECSRIFPKGHHLKLHMTAHSLKVFCSICDKKYSNKNSLEAHMQQMHGKSLLQEQSEDRASPVATSTENQEDSDDDTDASDSEYPFIPTYKCSRCPREFLSTDLLDLHESTHLSDQLFMCMGCGKKFFLEKNLKFHMVMNPQCKINIQTPTASAFQQTKVKSIMVVPNELDIGRTYKCPYCERGFPTITYLKQHIQVHSSAKTFACKTGVSEYVSKGRSIQHIIQQGQQNAKTSAHESTLTSIVRIARNQKFPTIIPAETVSTLPRSEGNNESGCSSSSTTSDIDNLTMAESDELSHNNDVIRNASPQNISTPMSNEVDIINHQISNSSDCLTDKMSVEPSVQGNQDINDLQNNASLPPFVTTTQPTVPHNLNLPLPGFGFSLNFASFTQNTGSNIINGQAIGINQVNQSSFPALAAPYCFMPYCFPFNQMQQIPAPYNLGSFGQTAAGTFSHCANQSQGMGVNHFAHNPMFPQNWGFYQNPGMIFPNLPNVQPSFRESDVQPKSVGAFNNESIWK